jgi:hypothetical protein
MKPTWRHPDSVNSFVRSRECRVFTKRSQRRLLSGAVCDECQRPRTPRWVTESSRSCIFAHNSSETNAKVKGAP